MYARRFLHCCWCCDDLDAATAWLTGAFGLCVAMRPSDARRDGSILGLDREIEARVAFVYDGRGPRTSPAIEVSAWVDPPATGTPYVTPNHVGIHAIGIAAPDLDGARRAAIERGAVAFAAPAHAPHFEARAVSLRDPSGTAFDLVGVAALGATQLRHLRVTCRDLDRSVAWYEAIGFRAEAPDSIEVTPGALGPHGPAALRVAQLGLPDEPTALLLHQWIEPASAGAPYPVPYHRGLYRIALAVDDTRAALAGLEAVGIRPARPVQRVALGGTKVPDMWIAFLHDPDGIPVELVERPRSAFR